MSGDYSRKTFYPQRDFSGVLMQQGRVQLDADWNEMIAIISRRLRAETTDIIGRGTVPKETPDGFKIEINANGELTIGRGRIYVDGLLAENHGAVPLEFDSVLAEQRGTQPISYDDQPYFPNVENVASLPKQGGPYLFYLDVWQREVTYLQNSDLIEKAVGVDTTTRLQTVWQIRSLARIGGNVTCATPDDQIPGWLDIIRSSDGRLSTAAVGVASEDDPCVIPPTGGYRGLENRFYRVEIHDGGAAGTATFKWSRDNASIATNVTAITSLDKITVARVGRDATLRFKIGDWIEITDDWLEFAQQPGLIRQIKNVDDATQIITLTSALPAGIFATDGQGNTDSTRHTRVTRWDQSGKISDTNGNLLVDLDATGSDGLIPVPAAGTSIILEDGVQITFDTPANGIYRVADFWSFAARTADASVEILSQAPPRGIHHHFCRLAIVTFPNSISDCRIFWPPNFGGENDCCDCSVCVTAELHNNGTLTIQQAIDQIKDVGGTVCLDVGIYNLGETPVNIVGAKSLTIRGQGTNTVLTYIGAGSAILIQSSTDVTIEKFELLTADRGKDSSAAVALHNSSEITLQRNTIMRLGANDIESAAIGLGGILFGVLIRENFLAGPIGIGRLTNTGDAETKNKKAVAGDADIALLSADLVIEENTFDCSLRGISFDNVSIHAFQTRLAGNVIVGCSQAAIAMLGWVALNSGMDVRENELHVIGSGIVIGTDNTRIESNNIAALSDEQDGDGIILTQGFDQSGLDRCQIFGNRIVGLNGNGIHVAAGTVRSAMIKNNFVQAVSGGGIVMDDKSRAVQLTIENNKLLDIVSLSTDAAAAVAGLRIVNAVRVEIISNAVIGVGIRAAKNPGRAGIQLVNVDSGRVDGNEVINIGPPGEFAGDTVGIESLGTFSRLDITNNIVRRNLATPAKPGTARWFAVRVGSLAANKLVTAGTNLAYIAVNNVVYAFAGGILMTLPRGKEMLGIQANLLEAYGATPAVSVSAEGVLTLSTNRCLLNALAAKAVVQAQAGAVVASGNYLEGPPKFPSLVLQLLPENGPFTVLGNISSGNTLINNNVLMVPWAALNIVAP
jgi:hypothetical protein